MAECVYTEKIAVRNLIEFLLRHGDIDASEGFRDPDAMTEGTRLHKKIQKSMGGNYSAEVPMSESSIVEVGEEAFEIIVEGRADGIMTVEKQDENEQMSLFEEVEFEGDTYTIIDEIKCFYQDIESIKEMRPLHRAQAMCYAAQYVRQNGLSAIAIQLTYCNIETEAIKRLQERFRAEDILKWYDDLIAEYVKWVAWKYHWGKQRDASMKQLQFPFAYRPGQKDLAAGVYRTIARNKNIFIEAPTGVGKTVSTLFPAVKAFGEGLVEKIFYLTAKTITRTVAEETFRIMEAQGLKMKLVTLTSKEKSCILEKPNCNPEACVRAKGHFDRVNAAVFDMLTHEEGITRELILSYAEKYCVCPFEMCLDVTTWADGIICDYNYVFDPNAQLKRFFAGDRKQNYVFLIDEAHNLVERGREMYSAVLIKEHFLEVRRIVKDKSPRLAKQLDACNKLLLNMKRECDELEVWENAGELPVHLMRLMMEYELFLKEHPYFEGRDEVLQLYFDVRYFMNIHDVLDENYLVYSDYTESGDFRVILRCMDPSKNLERCTQKGRSAVFFSATLLPVRYYKEQLGGHEEDYAIYAPSPFDTGKRLLMIGTDVSTKYTRRGEEEYERIVGYIEAVTQAKKGNYMVFFPSYRVMEEIYEVAKERVPNILIQESMMTEAEREEFLEAFAKDTEKGIVGFCVMGGIFSEGIDLKGERLIGVIVVGTGLPMVCNERELSRGFFDNRGGNGFEYAYLYSGMNKVQQSAGRVIRTVEDTGVILLLDERFQNRQYQELFPREWFPHERVRLGNVREKIEKFWKEQEK